jgi:hypothetical protein
MKLQAAVRRVSKMTKLRVSLSAGVLAVVFALSLCAVAESEDQVVFRGHTFCLGLEDCPHFADWGPTAGGVVILFEADGVTPSDYLWMTPDGFMTFESDNESGGFARLPPAGLPVVGTLIENGDFQEIDFFFPGFPGSNRTLTILSDNVGGTTPEPSTLLLFGPAAVFLFSRARRFWRA